MPADRDSTLTIRSGRAAHGVGGIVGRYRLRVWRPGNSRPLAIVTELEDNPGLSVTNAAELVHLEVVRRYPGAVVIEHYSDRRGDRFALVQVQGGRAIWEPVHPDVLPPDARLCREPTPHDQP